MIFLQASLDPPESFQTSRDRLRWLCLSRRFHKVALIALYKAVTLYESGDSVSKFIRAAKQAPHLARHTEFLWLFAPDLYALDVSEIFKYTPRVKLLVLWAGYSLRNILAALSCLPSLRSLALMGSEMETDSNVIAETLIHGKGASTLSRLCLIAQSQVELPDPFTVRLLAALHNVVSQIASSLHCQCPLPYVLDLQPFNNFGGLPRSSKNITQISLELTNDETEPMLFDLCISMLEALLRDSTQFYHLWIDFTRLEAEEDLSIAARTLCRSRESLESLTIVAMQGTRDTLCLSLPPGTDGLSSDQLMAAMVNSTYNYDWAFSENITALHIRVPHISKAKDILYWLPCKLHTLELGGFEYGVRGDMEISDVAAVIRDGLLQAPVKKLGLYSCYCFMQDSLCMQQRQDAFNWARRECAIRHVEFKDDADDVYAPS